MASVFSSENRIVALIAAQGTSAAGFSDSGVDIRSLFKELGIRLEETFHFTREQTVSIQINHDYFWSWFKFISFARLTFVECAKTQSSIRNCFDLRSFTLKLRWVLLLIFNFLVLIQGVEEEDAAWTRLVSNGEHFWTTCQGEGIYGHCTAYCIKRQECLSARGVFFLCS